MSFLSPLCALDIGSTAIKAWFDYSDQLLVVPMSEAEGRSEHYHELIDTGRIADDERVGNILHPVFFSKRSPWLLTRPRIMAAVPCCFTEVEKRAVVRSSRIAGALGTQLVSMALCAASGAGADLSSSRAIILLSCGGEFSELAVLISGTQTHSTELRFTMKSLKETLQSRISREFGVHLDPFVLESHIQTQLRLGEEGKDWKIAGKSVHDGKVREIPIPYTLVLAEAERFFEQQVVQLEQALGTLDPVLAHDLIEQGILLYGGVAQLPGLSLFISSRLHVPVSVVTDPVNCVVLGLKDIASSISFMEFDEENEESQVLGC